MNFKGFILILTLFLVLFVGISAVSAETNDTIDNITSEADEVISSTYDGNSSQDNVEIISSEDSPNQQNQSSSLNSTQTRSAKSKLKITAPYNFVKKGGKYYIYLKDSKSNPVANKKLTIKYNGKTLKRTTDEYGKTYINIRLSKSYTIFKVSFNGDAQYWAVTKNFKVYVENSLSMTIGNSKLLNNGFLRVYLKGPKKMVCHKSVKIIIGKKIFKKRTSYAGYIVIKPQVNPAKYNVVVKYKKYWALKTIHCIEGNVSDPLKTAIPTKNGAPDMDVMPKNYIMGNNNAKYTLKKVQYIEVLKRDRYSLFLHGKLSKYTFFKTKTAPNTYHVMKREKWNVIERAILTKVVKKNKYGYWPSSITVSLKGKSYTYPEVRDIQNSEVTCGPTSTSVCTQVLKNYHSEKYFQIKMNCVKGVNIPVIKKVLEQNHFKAYYFDKNTIDYALEELKNGGALIAFLNFHYVSIIDISPDGKKILVSNSYGDYNVGGMNNVPTGWVSLKYFKTKFGNTGLVVKNDYNLSQATQNQINNFYSSMGPDWHRQNTRQKIPEIGL